MNILGICENPDVLNVTRLIVLFINIIKALVPIILILVLMVRLVGAMTKGNEDAIASIKKTAPSNIVAAVLIFLVPTFVSIVVKISFPNSEYSNCIYGISKETVTASYQARAEKLVQAAEKSLSNSDYITAMTYLSNIGDELLKDELKKRLEAVKLAIDTNTKPSNNGNNTMEVEKGYPGKDYGKGSWVFYPKNSDELKKYYNGSLELLGFFEYVPEKVVSSGDSLPLIIWLHGLGEVGASEEKFKDRGLLKIINEWDSTGLKNIPAVIIAPQLKSGMDSWTKYEEPTDTIRALASYAKAKYNINTNKVILMGHSLGGSGVEGIKSRNQDLFSALVVFSGYWSSPGNLKEYYTKIPMKGYTEEQDNANPPIKTGELMTKFFKASGHINDLTIYKNESHGSIPKKALTEDSNNDKISDLIYWALSQNK